MNLKEAKETQMTQKAKQSKPPTFVFGKTYAQAYDILYKDKDYAKECDFLEAVFNRAKIEPRKILDLGWGTGNHSLILAQRGYDMTGVDRSKDMISIALVKCSDYNANIKFTAGDITNINLSEKFDAVISMFAVMSYQITNASVANTCKTAFQHLNKGGLFIFDCWHGSAVLTDKLQNRVKEVSINEHEKVIRNCSASLDVINHVATVQYKLERFTDSKMIHDATESHSMRFFFPQELRYFLEVAGFKSIEFYSFPDLNKPLDIHDWNMAVVARA